MNKEIMNKNGIYESEFFNIESVEDTSVKMKNLLAILAEH